MAIDGGPGNDTLNGTSASDVINGKAGNDILNGLAGEDVLNGDENDDVLNGGDGNDVLQGGIGNDKMAGGKGDDQYYVDSVGDKLTELAGQGSDIVISSLATFTLGANFEKLYVNPSTGSGTGNNLDNFIFGNGGGGNTLDGAGGNDWIDGDAGNDSLVGGAGNDTLEGGLGADSMSGGAGNDTYYVSEPADLVTEGAGGGIDTILARVSGINLTAYANVENLQIVSAGDFSATGSALNNRLTGNTDDNVLMGLTGNDTLDGGGGDDTLQGGSGNDTYLIYASNDKVLENAGEGKDAVTSFVNYTLIAGQEIEALTLGGLATSATGNEFNNTISSTGANSFLSGGGGNDTLIGGAGNDTLDGGTGADSMKGGKGDDWYEVDSLGDKVVEGAGQGVDTVHSTITSLTLAANVENLYVGSGLNGTGNTLNNYIEANSLANQLDGGGGNDSLVGNDGNDTLLGGTGNDVLNGGQDADSMKGGAGSDAYLVDNIGDAVNEDAAGGIDIVFASIDYTLATNVENLQLTGTAVSGTGNGLANFLLGTASANLLDGGVGNDTLNGLGGADTLIGGVGNDVYRVINAGVLVQETAGKGVDTVVAEVDFTLDNSQEIEFLKLDSAGPIIGTGNDLANSLTMLGAGAATLSGSGGNDTVTGAAGNDLLDGGLGNDVITGAGGNDTMFGDDGKDKLSGGDGNDSLSGDAGNDTMIGGKGDDYYYVTDAGDVVTEAANQGHDAVESHITNYTLGANVEDLWLGFGAVNGTGNTLNNQIFGNFVANSLSGGTGNDLLVGDDGADTLKGGAGNDRIEGGLGADILYGEAGTDVFLYGVANKSDLALLGGDVINGFQHGIDKIALADLIGLFAITPANAFSGEYVKLVASGADTLVQFDSDGSGGGLASPLTLATVTGVTVTQSDVLLTGSA